MRKHGGISTKRHSYGPGIVLVLLICLSIVLAFALTGCGGDDSEEDALLGVWADETGVLEFEFKPDGVVLIRAMGDEQESTYSADDGMISATDPDTGEVSEVEYTIDGDTLLLGADGAEGVLIRKTDSES